MTNIVPASLDGTALAVSISVLTKRFGRVTAVDGVSLDVPAGGVFGLLGPNGSGKTTLLSLVSGFIRPTDGTLTLFGRDGPAGQAQALHNVGALIERPIFWPYLNCRDNLKCLQGVYGSDGGDAEIEDLLDAVNLGGDAARRKFRACSTGMKQRLGIAATLLGDPSLLILDEPTNGLDPVGIVEVRDLIRSLAADGRRTVILASHLLNEVEQVCDRVAILRRGKLLYCGPVADMGAPASALVRTTDDERAATVLKDAGWEIRARSADGLEIAAIPGREWEISRDLAHAGVYVSQLRPASTSLEAGFMEVTGEGQQASA
ncbi:MAG: ABC transporter ATP-binding protein [Chloroflexota bacterium]|nr:ABC transporter ATP-binding protein [Chloroflexota bacterium]MDE2961891.1 ABC transporter ATP-binding protein [Chloroflexota bacterium]